ncbi:tRNA uridine-5-carboxymethylaminomethyl(34) synthesis GTPase MnmE [Nitratifractor salsuginis]|uniref:tRNA modification GTPase MnmE n=1 Tax=Nitratifractor salsuginis (strain DSM 16511 / JCM 12458 / E9I37-1) TaxID=749222 RepID=E6WYW6_NITSE|nr:tRNA uridine-5-carboxymethylaminomethyl(34) synthesis GTPase MnmE [Nitratifractor salsuginis]ADV46552.1 tRNA modification GTPase trmE [Nitratifractor salsuginis DSM 16511]
MNDTIAAIATAHGVASISIIRLSGPQSLDIARKIAPKATFTPRYAQLCDLFDAEGVLIDRGIVLRFQAPHSYTGEEIVEFQVHGGLVVAEQILESARRHGARLAEPGEFSKRAFLNGKIDLSEAEAIAKMIEAKSADAARILARQIKGELGRFVEESREKLLRALAHSEVMIDYAEEDIPEDLIRGLEAQLVELKDSLERIVQSSRRRRGLIEGFRVAIVGKPNVGKSSLLNAMLSYERAIVSDVAGTTRDTIEEQIRIGSHIVRIIDTAGIRQTEDRVERIGVERSLASLEEAEVVIALFDASRPWEREDERILERIEALRDKELIVALNKTDLPRRLEEPRLEKFHPLEISARRDFSHLMEELQRRLDALGQDEELMLASERQIEAVEECARQIREAVAPLKQGELEFFSYHIQEAVQAISRITRPYESEQILDRMFGEFCLGK